MDLILKYFPDISEKQKEQFAALYGLYQDWNAKINVISRKDIGNLYERHVLHSLGIAKLIRFRPGTSVMDMGTGGGFPGIPLAILFPECRFHLIDGTGKKVHVAEEVAQAIGLENATFRHARGEEEKGVFNFVVSRAVMPLPDLIRIIRKNISKKPQTGKNGFGLSISVIKVLFPVIKVLSNHPKEHTGGAEIAAPTILKWQGGYF